MTPSKRSWTAADVPDQTGRSFVITGANSGIGLEAARVLAQRGGAVLLAVRNLDKGAAAREDILATAPDAQVDIGELDLADLKSIRRFADRFHEGDRHLDVLINNAGIMGVARGITADGFELQIGTNHLGHFALTGLLMQDLLKNDAPRVVTVSSLAHRGGEIDFDDLMSRRRYSRAGAYQQSKLANLLFTMELQRRFKRAGLSDARSLACHPGMAGTELGAHFVEAAPGPLAGLMEKVNDRITQSPADGALPTLRAATDPDADGGDYFGPDGRGELHGNAAIVKAKPKAYDVHDARGLWETSVDLTQVDYAELT